MFDLMIDCFRDYGIIHVDTTGNSFGIGAETGIDAYWPQGFDSNKFLKYLPWEDLQMIAVGSDANYYPGA